MSTKAPKCGTYSAYQRHRRNDETPCDACRKAQADYMREYRKKSTRWRDQENARKRALWHLADRHRDEFQRLYIEERNRQRVEQLTATR